MGKRILKHTLDIQIKPLSSETGEISISDFLRLFEKFLQQKTLEGLRERTLKDYNEHYKYLKKFLEGEHRSIENRSLDIDLIRAYIYYMQEEKKLSSFTINVRLRTLKCLLKWLWDEGYIKTALHVKVKLQKTPDDTIKPLSDSDVKKMLKTPDRTSFNGYRDFVLMVLMLDCGIRTIEAISIESGDVDLRNGFINIWPDIAKTGMYRQVPISKKTAKLIENLIKNNNEKSSYVFQSTYGGAKMDTNAIVHAYEKYAKQANITSRATGHVWRHTFAVNFLRGGGDAFTLQRILGHTTMSTVRKYVQLSGTDVKEQHNKVKLLDNYI